jgi:hypothetical protein
MLRVTAPAGAKQKRKIELPLVKAVDEDCPPVCAYLNLDLWMRNTSGIG